ncbi:MAG: hypothetical protein NWS62_01205 [Gaiellales bacterium]|jgi:hypothetical protein|nr:hypothetical protein [Gaiellales bacterium]
MNRKGRLIALGICAAIGAAFAVPSIVGADAPVPLARNSYAVSGFKVSPEGKQVRSIVPTNSKGKFPLRTMDLSQVPWGTTMTGVVGVEFTSASTCNKGGSFSTSCTAAYGGSASFPLQLPKPLRAAKVGILGGLNENGDCAGSFEKPSAPPGFLCVYPGQTGSSGEYFDKGEADIFNVAKNGDGAWAVEVYPLTGNASKFGFRISAVASLAGPAKFYGTWAYTAPTKEIPLTDTAS